MQTLLPISLLIGVVLYGCSASRLIEADRISASTMNSLMPGLRVLVLGDDPAAVKPVGEDLQRMGVTLVDSKRLQGLFGKHRLESMNIRQWQATLLQIARLSGTDLLVFVDVGMRVDFPSVVVKGVDVETGEVLWNGSAVHNPIVTSMDYGTVITRMARRALLNGLTNPQDDGRTTLSSVP